MSLRSVIQVFKNRDDTEHEQSLVRLAIIAVVILYYYLFSLFDPSFQNRRLVVGVLVPYTTLGFVNLWWIVLRPESSRIRIITFAVIDQLMCGIAVVITGKLFIPLTFIVQIISIGVGLRFGVRYLYLSTVVAAVVGGVGIWIEPFWHAHREIAAGYLAGLILVPLYSAILGGRIRHAQLQSEHRAEMHKRVANTDTLTGVASRSLLEERLTQLLAEEGSSGAILELDLDGFKVVNDTYGHAVGDQLLIQVAAALTHCVRASDLVARLGGDEFCIVLHGAKSQNAAQPVAAKIIEAVNQIDHVGEAPIHIGISIGIASYPQPEVKTPGELLRIADAAMYAAKRAGKNRYAIG